MRFGLRARLTLLIGGLVALLVTVTGVITTVREKNTLEIELRKRGTALAVDLAKFMTRPLIHHDLAALRRFVNDAMTQDYVRYLYVLDPDGTVVMHNDLAEVGKILGSAAGGLPDEPRVVDARNPASGEKYCAIDAPILVADVRLGTIHLGYSYKAVEAEIAAARRQIAALGTATIVAGSIVAYFLAVFISSPVKMITEAQAGGRRRSGLQARAPEGRRDRRSGPGFRHDDRRSAPHHDLAGFRRQHHRQHD